MRLREIMSRRVEAVRPDERLDRAQRRMLARGVRHLVVLRGRKVVGVLSDSELQTRLAEGVARVEDAMFRHILVASPNTTVTEAARMMRGRPEGALPVFTGSRLVGIVTVSDLLDVLASRHAGAARTRRTSARRSPARQAPRRRAPRERQQPNRRGRAAR